MSVNFSVLDARAQEQMSLDAITLLLREAGLSEDVARTHTSNYFTYSNNPAKVKLADFLREYKRMIVFASIRELNGVTTLVSRAQLHKHLQRKSDSKTATQLMIQLGITSDLAYTALKQKYKKFHQAVRVEQEAIIAQPQGKQRAKPKQSSKRNEKQQQKQGDEKKQEEDTQGSNSDSPHEIIFVLGGPGAGKGTQCAKIAEEYKYVHLSAGDLLRAERKKAGSPNADLINNYIAEGKIVPVEITVKLLLTAMDAQRGSTFLIDGFPRNEDNKDGWYRVVGKRAVVTQVLFYDCPLDELKRRLLKRGETSGRSDDNEASIVKRFETFRSQSMPVVEWYRGQGILTQISSAQSIEAVWAETQKALASSSTQSSGVLEETQEALLNEEHPLTDLADQKQRDALSGSISSAMVELRNNIASRRETWVRPLHKESTQASRPLFFFKPEVTKTEVDFSAVLALVFATFAQHAIKVGGVRLLTGKWLTASGAIQLYSHPRLRPRLQNKWNWKVWKLWAPISYLKNTM
jgi:UMP-CMP kinase